MLGSAELLTIAVGGQGLLYYLPLVIAQQLGYFEAEGLAVRIEDYPGGSQSLQALESGAADVCAGAYEHTLLAQQRGSQLRAFVVQGVHPRSRWAWLRAGCRATRRWPICAGGAWVFRWAHPRPGPCS